jgi:hypothetical protein
VLKAEWVSDRDDELTRTEIRGSTELDDRKRTRTDAEQREIGVGIVPEHIRVMAASISRRHVQMLGARHHMTVRQDQAIGREDEPGPGSFGAA